eukprot:525979-Heterocapsa_arctica.AAC.1
MSGRAPSVFTPEQGCGLAFIGAEAALGRLTEGGITGGGGGSQGMPGDGVGRVVWCEDPPVL